MYWPACCYIIVCRETESGEKQIIISNNKVIGFYQNWQETHFPELIISSLKVPMLLMKVLEICITML